MSYLPTTKAAWRLAIHKHVAFFVGRDSGDRQHLTASMDFCFSIARTPGIRAWGVLARRITASTSNLAVRRTGGFTGSIARPLEQHMRNEIEDVLRQLLSSQC